MAQLTDDVVNRLLATGKAAGAPVDLPNDEKGVIVPDGYQIHTYQDKYKLPPRIIAQNIFSKLESFIEYVKGYRLPATTIFGAFDNNTITAYLDYHAKDVVAAVKHTASYAIQKSTEWIKWTEINGKQLSQLDFAEFLEENGYNVVEPDGATLLEIVSNLQAKTEVTFQSSIRLANGTAKVAYQEDQTSKAGATGSFDIPTKIKLILPVYRYGANYPLEAFLRVRIDRGKAVFVVKLDNHQRVILQAFTDVCNEVTNQLGLTVLEGVYRGQTL